MPEFTADPRSTVFSKSANPLDPPQKSTIRGLFKAKSIDSKTYWHPSELLTNVFSNYCVAKDQLTNAEFRRNSRLKKSTLVRGFPQLDYIAGKNNHFNYKSGEKKKKWSRWNDELWECFHKTRSLEQYERPFDLSCHSEINKWQLLRNLTFIRRNTRFFAFVCFPDTFSSGRS